VTYRHLFLILLFGFTLGIVVATFGGFEEFLPGLLRGSLVTIGITLAAFAVALVMGLAGALGKMYGPLPVRWLAVGYIEVFRGTSAVVQLFWIFYVLPYFGVTIEALSAAVVALGLNVGAYGSEVNRGAIQAVPKGQWEACTALNLSWASKMRRIVLPQAVLAAIPPWGNLFIETLKASALVSFISVTELAFRAKQMNQTTFQTFEIFLIALVLYFIISQVINFAMHSLEQRAARGLSRGRVS